MENSGAGKLFVFVGEKIEIKELNDEKNIMDAKFVAKYKILERICGDHKKDTIEFIVYDHYGRPSFEEYKNVLLFVSEYSDTFYHNKYQYFDLYKTKDGRWASPYEVDEYKHPFNENISVKPVAVEFEDEVSYSIHGRSKKRIKYLFPEPYYKISNGKAIAVWGNYIPELFQLKKGGVLKARGLFGNPDSLPPVKEMTLEEFEVINISKPDCMNLIRTWHKLFTAIKTKNEQRIKGLSLNKLICSVCEGMPQVHFENDVESIDSFIVTSYRNFPKSQLWKNMRNNKFKISSVKYPTRKPEHFEPPKDERLVIYSVSFETVTQFEFSRGRQSHSFQFVKINGQYKFYGMESN